MTAQPGEDPVDRIVAQWRRERPDLEASPMAVFGRIYRIARLMGDRVAEIYQEYGIGRGEFDVLATLRRAGAPYTLSPKAMTATLMLTSGGMTGRLDRLERAGLITRTPDSDDRRALRVSLTETGLRVIEEAVAAGLEPQHEALAVLSEEDRRRLAALLRQVLAALE
ncbi:MarR family winged helix-turn-helix transcriptional regulator [Planomonospora venezuelensis]|uniref:DNA-binding MarR family transcriptional regulator n=1 Tax=Planomonospora venezuelensis TaxID=1999 RepID=A0A841D8R1_PLAVE|nr:MarR family transcriptional regulator [Planomonospora venezuelensis]MBB5964515.1 DNA-binding MarR family transcriptional regulator [Planomonospora venezuelensis]GIN05295.1 MarR family transcriptional regulator [Planomonospora venezuelensis]